MTVVGGAGTLYGAVVGAAIFVVAQSYLASALGAAAAAVEGLPLGLSFLARLLAPERLLLWLGLLFVVTTYAFPRGIIGSLRQRRPTT